MSLTIRKLVFPILFAIMGFWMIIDYLFVIPPLNSAAITARSMISGMANFATWVGIIVMLSSQAKTISKRKPKEWLFSMILIATTIIMAASGILGGLSNNIFMWIFNNVFTPTNSATFAFLAFYVSSASVRAMRIKNIDATLVLVSAVLTMFSALPAFNYLWPGFTVISSWLSNVPVTASMMAITIGMALGVAGVSVKMLFGQGRVQRLLRGETSR